MRSVGKGDGVMRYINTSFTNVPEARVAAARLVEEASHGLAAEPSLAILLSTVDYDLPALVGAVQAYLGDTPLWGGTSSSGVLTEKGWLAAETGAAALMLVSDRPAGVSVTPIGPDPIAAGRWVTETVLHHVGDTANALLTMPAPGLEAELLAGVHKAAPRLPVVGGASGEHGVAGRMRQFANGAVYHDALSLAAVGDRQVGWAFAHGYKPTGKTAVTTEVVGHSLISLDNRPALEVYEEWTGLPVADVTGGAIMLASTRHPLVLRINGDTLAVHPVNGHDGIIDTGVALMPGATVELMENTLDGMLDEVAHVVGVAAQQVREPRAVFLAHCAGRALALGERIAEVPAQVRSAVGDIPMIGFLAYGEQGVLHPGKIMHGNLSLSALVLG